MSDGGEKTCPLCAEEMDLTDQQLKPCRCGYEICVWCWHQIMDMAEKDETAGRCPACRSPYNKEKIVGMAASCERLVAEMNMERKQKSQKAKNRTSEGRKQLSSVRVIQRNLAYIVGLPLNLADEDLLQRKDYFGQYGKVLKVSISRTAAGTIQHFANNSCSVYITYSKEEEAIRCIQSVHGFVLEGRSLRACFGTTKYCHAWLRNVTCSNPDCLYLHEIGSHDDSFTKDEIISAYTRSRVQQITGATNSMQRRSGNVLPPPADEYCNDSFTSSGKPITKSASNIPASSGKGSPPNISPGRSVALPAGAAWGMRSSNSMAPPSSLACTNGSSKQKIETYNSSTEFSTAVASTTQVSALHGDIGKMLIPSKESYTVHQPKGSLELQEYPKHYSGTDQRATVSEAPVKPELSASPTMNSQLCYSPASKDKDICLPPDITNSSDVLGQACGSCLEKNMSVSSQENIQSLCSDMSSISIDRSVDNEHSGGVRPNSSFSDQALINSHGNRVLQHYFTEQSREPLASVVAGNAMTSVNDICVSREQCGHRSDLHDGAFSDVDEDVLPSDDERLKEIEVTSQGSYLPNSSRPFHLSNRSLVYSSHHNEAHGSMDSNVNTQIIDRQTDKGLLQYKSGSVVSNGYPENQVGSSTDLDRVAELSYFLPNERRKSHMGGFEGDTVNVAVDMGENNIISNILSMDFDAWDESLTSPQNFAKLLGESGEPQGSFNASGSWKVQNSNQSRFSFARQEESNGQVYGVEPSISNTDQMPINRSFSCDFVVSGDSNFDKLSDYNSLSSTHVEGFDNLSNSHFHLSSNKLSVSRAQTLAPPGFSLPSRAPPPGFTSHERVEQVFDSTSGNHLLNNSSFRNLHQGPSTGNLGSSGDIEFMDPAILAVGKGRLPGRLDNPGSDIRSGLTPQLSALENEARLQVLMQRSLSPHQNLRFLNADNFSLLNDAYGIPSRIIEQSTASNLSPYPQLSFQQSRNAVMSNGHWDGWNEVQSGNDLGMADLLRNERRGFNKFFPTYEDSKFRMPSSGDLFNRTYGI